MTDPLRYDPARGWLSPEELLVEALDAVLDAEDDHRAKLVTMARLALDDGTAGVMRDCLIEIVTQLSSHTSDGDQAHDDDDHSARLIARLRAGKV